MDKNTADTIFFLVILAPIWCLPFLICIGIVMEGLIDIVKAFRGK